MKSLYILLLALAMLCPVDTYASIHGALKGKVVDENGDPLIGATVRIVGTTRGAIVKSKDGTFTLVNIPVGTFIVRVTFMGKEAAERQITFSAAKTDYAEFTLTAEGGGARTKELEVFGNREMVRKDDIGSQQSFSGSAITNVAREGVTGVVSLSAGVDNSGNGFNIRGSRDSETLIRVDGFDLSNQFTGGMGIGGTAYFPMVSAFATEQVQVLTGGFSAEFGDAMGGIVNTMVKTGRLDKYEVFLRWRTDAPALNGSQANGLQIEREGRELIIQDEGEGAKYQGAITNSVEFGVGGAVPLIPRTTFFLSGLYKFEKYRTNSYEIYDPLGNNLGQLDNTRTWVKNITGRMQFGITNNIQLVIGGMFGMSNFENAGWSWLYSTSEGTIDGVSNGIAENVAKQPVFNQLVANYSAKINHTLDQNSFYELKIANNINNDEFGRRIGYQDPSFLGGFEIYEPADEYAVSGSTLIPGKDKIIDIYTFLTKSQLSEDGYVTQAYPVRNPLTGYYEGNTNSTGTDNAYGLQYYFVTTGNSSGFQYRQSNDWQIKGDYNISLDKGDFSHNIRSGFEVRFWELHRHYNGNPYVANPFYDIYTDKWGGNIYADDQEVYDLTSTPASPFKFAAYVQDQLSFKGIVFTPGLRIDYFDPSSDYRTNNNTFIAIGADSGFASSDPKIQISPRLNVTYPITERSTLSIAYGIYFRTPELQNMYDKFFLYQLRSGDILGNPNMDAQRTNAYQVSYANQLTDDFVLNLSAYYKDIYNQLGVQYVPATPVPFFQYTVSEYGNTKGLEATLTKRASNNYGFLLNYTLAYVTGTSNSPSTNASILLDPFTQQPMFPLATYPQNWDVRHRVKLNAYLTWADNEGPSIGGIQLLENTNIIFTGNYRSGFPYTRTDPNGNPLSERNAERQPSFWNLDLRLSKAFMMKDIFGESAGYSRLELFADVNNLLNRTAVTAFYSATGDPDDNGRVLVTQVGNFSSITFYESADFANPATYSPSQYDSFGRRLYNANSDFDNNGLVTQAEKYQAFVNYAETALSFRGNYMIPRQVFVGINFNF